MPKKPHIIPNLDCFPLKPLKAQFGSHLSCFMVKMMLIKYHQIPFNSIKIPFFIPFFIPHLGNPHFSMVISPFFPIFPGKSPIFRWSHARDAHGVPRPGNRDAAPGIDHVAADAVVFQDGTQAPRCDCLVLCTGYRPSAARHFGKMDGR